MGILGAKTQRLKELQELGFNVPKFVAIDNTEIVSLDFESSAKKAHKELNCESYAVRSSALVEDSANKSFAGQFETKLAIPYSELANAIREVVAQAKEFLAGDIAKFSIIIQEFISPDFSGVTFTRNPLGGREMVVEYHRGIGEDLVSGKIKPEKLTFYWSATKTKSPLPNFATALDSFKKIENHYKFPQDIEWCIRNGKWYFLQTRPITTIDKLGYEQSLYLDENLPRSEKFYFEKTEISEIAPRPTPITQSLLREIYSAYGPIKQVYAKYGIEYREQNILKIIGNELFIDRYAERKTLLGGFLRSIKNLWRLNRIKLDDHHEIYEQLKEAIANKDKPDFMEDYKLVFEVNLLAGCAFKRLEVALGKDKNKMVDILASRKSNYDMEFDKKGLKGNALEVADESEFITGTTTSENSEEWFENLPNIKKKTLEKPIMYAAIYNQLREFSRWLVVKNVNLLRNSLLESAKNFKKKELVYFVGLDEVKNGKMSEAKCAERKKRYNEFAVFTFPKVLLDTPTALKNELLMVSAGKAEGVLVTEKTLKTTSDKKILYTQNLEPSLTKYFGEIEGIVAEHGSLLSHLAIIAREEKLPVIVNFSLAGSGLETGDKVEINDAPVGIEHI